MACLAALLWRLPAGVGDVFVLFVSLLGQFRKRMSTGDVFNLMRSLERVASTLRPETCVDCVGTGYACSHPFNVNVVCRDE